ncbi:two pore domain potassium channel family protein [Sulfitobacter sp. KE29]|uniref:potassium channel family protein n=1 Tax=Sulfitobacter TaxID=60136 RepID=UPI0009ED12DE|nr:MULTISPECIES: potassium channel family protein [Sulfitobacter]MBO9440416.1 two pore domain potassium channel family protein [Sulfitobacter sp. R18_2]MDF3420284.1 two pore domain potassium channel family protein [Sulfitobacter sp. Ks38]MDF3427769.1 two pore domain potassium channel family protein [Sulfitobacter sp. KE29]MDF3431348.1 two pore domain potassium channel family protein [Sulfitobacter sp. S46]MDF3446122.1 two pore domain potassium channel family protein [Sulfitobacter sp. KE31]
MIQAMLLSVLVVTICTAIHYFVLKRVSDTITRRRAEAHGQNLGLAVGAITIAHVIEAFFYTLFFLWAVQGLQIGVLNASGPADKPITLMDYFYFSLVNFTTLGRGDLSPAGHLRFLTGIEAFHGFLMITASGSFLLKVMGGPCPLVREGMTRMVRHSPLSQIARIGGSPRTRVGNGLRSQYLCLNPGGPRIDSSMNLNHPDKA